MRPVERADATKSVRKSTGARLGSGWLANELLRLKIKVPMKNM